MPSADILKAAFCNWELGTTGNYADPLTTALSSLPRRPSPDAAANLHAEPLHRVRHCARSASDVCKSRTADAQTPGYATRTRHRQMTGRVIGSEVTRDQRDAGYSVMHKSINTAGKVTARRFQRLLLGNLGDAEHHSEIKANTAPGSCRISGASLIMSRCRTIWSG